MPVKGHSTILQSGNQSSYAASTVWVDVGDILEVTPMNIEADDIETSHMLTPNQFKTYTAGWADGGEVEVQVQYAKAKQVELYDLFRQDKGYRIVFPDVLPTPSGSKWLFNGYMKGLQNEVDREGLITVTLVFKVSGEPDFQAAA